MTANPSVEAAHRAAQKLLATTANFCRAIPFAAAGGEAETEIVTKCLAHWGSDYIRLEQSLAADGVAGSFDAANPDTVRPHGITSTSYHSAILTACWLRLHSTLLVLGLTDNSPHDIDDVPGYRLRTMAGVIKMHTDIDWRAAAIDLHKEFKRAESQQSSLTKIPSVDEAEKLTATSTAADENGTNDDRTYSPYELYTALGCVDKSLRDYAEKAGVTTCQGRYTHYQAVLIFSKVANGGARNRAIVANAKKQLAEWTEPKPT